jgi:hypothetical protein
VCVCVCVCVCECAVEANLKSLCVWACGHCLARSCSPCPAWIRSLVLVSQGNERINKVPLESRHAFGRCQNKIIGGSELEEFEKVCKFE